MNTSAQRTLPGGRGLFASVFVHTVAEFAAWIAVIVVAFEQGGASAAGTAVVVQLVPAGLLAPVLAAAGDRFARHRVLALAFAVEGAAAFGIAVALLTDAPLAVVYLFAAVFTASISVAPGTVASLLVHHAPTPQELMRWNVARSSVAASGNLMGPLLVAVVLAIAAPESVFFLVGAACAVTAILIGVRFPRDDRLPTTLTIATVLGDTARGVRYVVSAPGPRRVVVVLGVTDVILGSLDLVFVVVAYDQLSRGGSAAALLGVAFAGGTLAAAVVANRFLAVRLGHFVSVGAALITLPLLVLGHVSLFSVALLLAAVLGAGHGLIGIGGQTLLQRSCAETMTSRAFGALASATLIAAALGAALTGRLLDAGSNSRILMAFGAVSLIALMVGSLWLRSTERSLEPADLDTVSALRAVSFLESLPQPTLEGLARGVERRTLPGGVDVVVEGHVGDEFFVLMSGAVEVRKHDRVVGRLAAPASFGEVALLHDDVRTATVTTTETCEVAVVQRSDFLDGISRTATSQRDALAVAHQFTHSSEPDRADPLR